ncbi:hypothetical protein O181_048142 [Austropuccinia psidii MF-1]|uniref:SNF2 N-terminal domain-containing protein n=1 Tax=Austropuccinia psidii MF-1 TaxID=1389203 RepID=A0A9Q3DZA0_9BASI|nr:hypothetical protein [Austropuccinia psidii MF-1]
MSTPSQPLCIGMINICIQIKNDITFKIHKSHLDSWIILWNNQQKIFLNLPNHQNAIGSLPGTLYNTLIPLLGAPQMFMHCGPGGAWIENFQSNPTETLFVEGVFMTDSNDPSSSQKPNLALMFFIWYLNILFIIESFQKQDFKLKIPKEYDSETDTITQWIRPSHDDLPHSMIQTPLLPHQKTRIVFLWDRELSNGQSSHNLCATSPPGSTFNARGIITNKVISSFKSLSTNTPLGGLLADDMGLGKTIQTIALIGTSKQRLITNSQCPMPTLLNHQLEIRNIQAWSGWSTASQHLPCPQSSLII